MAAFKVPDKIKGLCSSRRCPASVCQPGPACPEFAGRGVGTSGVFPFATPDAAKNKNNSNNDNETHGHNERGKVRLCLLIPPETFVQITEHVAEITNIRFNGDF